MYKGFDKSATQFYWETNSLDRVGTNDNRQCVLRQTNTLPRSLSGSVLFSREVEKSCGHVGDQRESKKELTVSDSGRLSIVTLLVGYVTEDKLIRTEENRERRPTSVSLFPRCGFYPETNFLLAPQRHAVTRIPPRRFSPFFHRAFFRLFFFSCPDLLLPISIGKRSSKNEPQGQSTRQIHHPIWFLSHVTRPPSLSLNLFQNNFWSRRFLP